MDEAPGMTNCWRRGPEFFRTRGAAYIDVGDLLIWNRRDVRDIKNWSPAKPGSESCALPAKDAARTEPNGLKKPINSASGIDECQDD